MRVLLALTAFTLALTGCNGGEDFSDATVGGCPSGAGCTPTSRGEVLVELVGPRVENLGYRCGGTNVVFFTKSTESTSAGSNGEPVTVPAYNALCPSSAQNVEFFIGNGLFEGNYVSLGKILFPKQEALQRYTVTVADLENSPRRESADLPKTRNIAALIQGLDVEPLSLETIEIPDEAHDALDDNPDLAAPLTTADYAAFSSDWSPYIDKVNELLALPDSTGGSVFGPNPSPDVPLAKVKAANRYTGAGNYSFRSCLFITCRDSVSDDIISLNLPGRLSDDTRLGEWPLILPNGKIMGIGFAARASSSLDAEQELVAFGKDAKVNDLLQLENANIVSIEDGSNATSLSAKGRFLNKLIYSDFLPDNGLGNTDIDLNYPNIADGLSVDEKGSFTGTLLSGEVKVDEENGTAPLTAEIEAAPQAEPDQPTIQELADNGPYTLRLMRACLEGSNEPEPARCSAIPNLAQEVTSDGSGNYFPINGKDVTQEQSRIDFYSTVADVTDICLEVVSNPGQPDNGIVLVGPADGSCPTAMERYEVGFVSRTFLKAIDENTSEPASANLTLLIAPDAADREATRHFGVTVLGRVDMDDDADPCYRMYRTGDPNFNAKLRAAWVDDFYPYVQQKEWIDGLAEGESLEEADQEMLVAISTGAVQFFAGSPGGACDPLVP